MSSNFIKEILIATIVFLILDFFWVGIVMRENFNKVIYEVQGHNIELSLIPSMLAYQALIGGLYYFVIKNMDKRLNLCNILSLSIPFALCVYGTFDFTAAAIFSKWNLTTVFMDIFWGTIICSTTAICVGLSREMICCPSKEHVEKVSHSQ